MEALIRNFFYLGGVQMQALAYAGAGIVGTAVHYVVLASLLRGFMPHVVAASSIGAVMGGLVNYWLAHRNVFHSQVPHQVALPRFATVATFGIAINATVLVICAPTLGTIGGQFAASLAVLASGFSLNRIWSFRD